MPRPVKPDGFRLLRGKKPTHNSLQSMAVSRSSSLLRSAEEPSACHVNIWGFEWTLDWLLETASPSPTSSPQCATWRQEQGLVSALAAAPRLRMYC